MAMPDNLIFVRHGESEANILQAADKNGDESYSSKDFTNIADRSWRLTNLGQKQAEAIGKRISESISHFDRYIVSPFTRTRETAAILNLNEALWEENRVVRERSWGEIDSVPRAMREMYYPQNMIFQKKDPLYWAPPAGESIAAVAENRVRNLNNTLHREASEKNVIVVTHGEFIWASMLSLERWSDEEFVSKDSDPKHRVHNCMMVHYTRINPHTGEHDSKISWVKRAYPVIKENETIIVETEWEHFERVFYTNEELLKNAHLQEQRL